jgi:hypothetical protein
MPLKYSLLSQHYAHQHPLPQPLLGTLILEQCTPLTSLRQRKGVTALCSHQMPWYVSSSILVFKTAALPSSINPFHNEQL